MKPRSETLPKTPHIAHRSQAEQCHLPTPVPPVPTPLKTSAPCPQPLRRASVSDPESKRSIEMACCSRHETHAPRCGFRPEESAVRPSLPFHPRWRPQWRDLPDTPLPWELAE